MIIECSFLGSNCEFWTWINSSNLPSEIVITVWFRFFLLASVTNLAAISLERMHSTLRPLKHRLIKSKMFAAVWITTGLCSAIGVLVVFYPFTIKLSRSLSILYLTFFLFFVLIILVSYSSIAIKVIYGNQPYHQGATSREKKTDQYTVHCDSCICTAHAAIHYFLDSRFSVITHFHGHFASNMVSVILFFWFFVLCQLSFQSSLLCI